MLFAFCILLVCVATASSETVRSFSNQATAKTQSQVASLLRSDRILEEPSDDRKPDDPPKQNIYPTMSPTTLPSYMQFYWFFPTRLLSAVPNRRPTAVPSMTPTDASDETSSTEDDDVNSSDTNDDGVNDDGDDDATAAPTRKTPKPSAVPTEVPSRFTRNRPSRVPVSAPTLAPSFVPTSRPTKAPVTQVVAPTQVPSRQPTKQPTRVPTRQPTRQPTTVPTTIPTQAPSTQPTVLPSMEPTASQAVLTFTSTLTVTGLSSSQLGSFARSALVQATASVLGVDSSTVEFVDSQEVEDSGADGDRRALRDSSSVTVMSEELTATRSVEVTLLTTAVVADGTHSSAIELYNSLSEMLVSAVESGAFSTTLRTRAVSLGANVLRSASVSDVTTSEPQTTGTTDSDASSGKSKSLPTSMIIGMGVGAAAVLACIVTICWLCVLPRVRLCGMCGSRELPLAEAQFAAASAPFEAPVESAPAWFEESAFEMTSAGVGGGGGVGGAKIVEASQVV